MHCGARALRERGSCGLHQGGERGFSYQQQRCGGGYYLTSTYYLLTLYNPLPLPAKYAYTPTPQMDQHGWTRTWTNAMEVDPKLVCLRCPARQLALRLLYYGDGASESESVQGASEHDAFMACNPSLAKMMTAATFRKGQRGHVDLLMQVDNDVNFFASEMLFQVMNFNVDNGRPGVIVGANGPSFLQMAPDDNRIRKARVMTFWPAESYAKIVRARYCHVASTLEWPHASQRRVLPQPKPSRPFERPLHCAGPYCMCAYLLRLATVCQAGARSGEETIRRRWRRPNFHHRVAFHVSVARHNA